MAESEKHVLDLSEKNLKKLEKRDGVGFHSLILDNNELSKLENLDRFPDLEKLSACSNHLSRMYGVAKLHHLVNLDLSNNSIVWIEGLKELNQLSSLNLSGNSIKCIQNIQYCVNLIYLDLSKNIISALTDLSFLTKLQSFNLDGNKLTTLQNASAQLPHSLCFLSIADNCITDLNEVSHLCGLPCLEHLAIANNPCVLMTGHLPGFDYRPFVINWCLGIRLLDGYVVTQKESLKAEWLYSQGKGRHFQPGEHAALIEYLAQVCPLTSAEQLIAEDEERLTRILRMQRQHREDLLHEMSNSPKEKRKNIIQHEKSHLSAKSNLEEQEMQQKSESSTVNSELSQLENRINGNKQDRPIFNALAKSPITIEQIPTKEMLKTCFQSYEDRVIRPNNNLEMIKPINGIASYINGVTSTTPVRKVSVRRSGNHSPSSPATGRRSRTPRAQWKNRVSTSRGSSPQDSESRRTHVRNNSESDTSEECTWPYKSSGNQSPFRQRKQCSDKNTRHASCTALRHSSCQTPVHCDTPRSKTMTTISTGCIDGRRNINRVLQNGSLIPSPCHSPVIGSRASRSPIKKSISDNVICVTQQQEKLKAQKLKQMEKAVVKIQSAWRGYHARHYNSAVFGVRQEIRLRRMEDSIQLLHNMVLRQQDELKQEKELRMLQATDITKLFIQVKQIHEDLIRMSEAAKHQNLAVKEDGNAKNSLQYTKANMAAGDKNNTLVVSGKEVENDQVISKQQDDGESGCMLLISSPNRISPIGSPGNANNQRAVLYSQTGDVCIPITSESDTDSGWQSMIGSFGADSQQNFENGIQVLDVGKNDTVNGISGGIQSLCMPPRLLNNCSTTTLLHHGLSSDENLINTIRDNLLGTSLLHEENPSCIFTNNKPIFTSSCEPVDTITTSSNFNENSPQKEGSIVKLIPPDNVSGVDVVTSKAIGNDSLCSTPESSCTVIVQAAAVTKSDTNTGLLKESTSGVLNQQTSLPEKNTKEALNLDKQPSSPSNVIATGDSSDTVTEQCNSAGIYRYRNNETITDDEKTGELAQLSYSTCVHNASVVVETNVTTNNTEKKVQDKKELPQQKVNSSRSSISSAATVWETRVHNIEATLQQLQTQFKELEGTIGQILTEPESTDVAEVE